VHVLAEQGYAQDGAGLEGNANLDFGVAMLKALQSAAIDPEASSHFQRSHSLRLPLLLDKLAQKLDRGDIRTIFVEVPAAIWLPTSRLARIDFVARDAANRELGTRGEEFVLEFERKRLHDEEERPDRSTTGDEYE